jgi:hypothetical protein
MLAAAEGRTDDTKDKRSFAESQERAARLALIAATLACLCSATALILPQLDAVIAIDFGTMSAHPLVYLGLVDLVCTVFLALGMASIYPFIRFRAAFGVGFLGLLYLLQDKPDLALMVVGGSVGLYFCTIVISIAPAVLSALLALAGIGGFAYFLLM